MLGSSPMTSEAITVAFYFIAACLLLVWLLSSFRYGKDKITFFNTCADDNITARRLKLNLIAEHHPSVVGRGEEQVCHSPPHRFPPLFRHVDWQTELNHLHSYHHKPYKPQGEDLGACSYRSPWGDRWVEERFDRLPARRYP